MNRMSPQRHPLKGAMLPLLALSVGWCLAAAATVAQAAPPAVQSLDANAIAQASGTKASTEKDGVVRIAWSRKDVPVTIDGETFPPAAGLGSWAAFAPLPSGLLMMGDTVVFEDEVDTAMDAAFSHGLKVTALHNHFFYSKPPVFFMHIEGEGTATAMASGVKAIWDAIRRVRSQHPAPATHFTGGTVKVGRLDEQAISKAIGEPVTTNKGALKVAVGRTAEMRGVPIRGPMGISTWAAFVGTDKLASMDGDFVLTDREAQGVFRSLRKANIHIVAIHTHMMGETPTLYFMHFWGKGPALDLAHAFKSALDAQASTAGS